MSSIEDKKENKDLNNSSSFTVKFHKDETENFINDIIKEASKINHKNKTYNKYLFIKSVLFGFVVFCIFLFFIYSSYYFISHRFLNHQENCTPLPRK